MLQLRDYQQEAIKKIYESWQRGNRNVCAQLVTGAGKTVIFSSIVNGFQEKQKNCAVIAHRNELVSQASCTLALWGIPHRIIGANSTIAQVTRKHREKFGKSFVNPSATTAVVGVDTLIARADDLKDWAKQIHLWVHDENHHLTRNNKWGKAVEMFTNAYGLGVTATPNRADGQGIGRHADGYMDDIVKGPSMRSLIDRGFLADYEIVCPKSDLNVDDSPLSKNGDWSNQTLRKAAKKSKIVGDVVTNYIKYAVGRQAIVFATDVETADEISQDFNANGIRAVSLNGNSQSAFREQSVNMFGEKKIQVLVNVDLFDEGFNCLDSQTEILTPNGWKNYDNIKSEKYCYAWNPKTGEAEVVEVLAHASRFTKPDEKILTINSQHVDIRVTEGHRFFYRDVNYYKFPETGMDIDVKIRTGAEIYNDKVNKFALPLCAEHNYKGVDLTDDEIKLLGWYMTDGYIDKNGTLSISQVKKHYIPIIREIIKNIGLPYREKVRVIKNSYKPGTICHEFFIKKSDLTRLIPYMDKKNPPKILRNMTKEQFKLLWESMVDGNGSRKENKSPNCVTQYKGQADFIQEMAVLRGFSCMYGTYYTKNNVKMYNMRIRDSKWMKFYQKDKRGAVFNLFEPEEKELVWCVKNKLGTLITRRNGKIVILGNCPDCDVCIMARPTASLGKYLQQIGRVLRPAPNKIALVIDHVSNVIRHGLPDVHREWNLDRRQKKAKIDKDPDEIELTVCKECLKPYEKFRTVCPYCGFEKPLPEPRERTIEMVEGDLVLLTREMLERMRRSTELESPGSIAARVSVVAGPIAAKGVANRQAEKISAQSELKESIAQWAAIERLKGYSDREIHKKFYLTTGSDVLSALDGSHSRQEFTDMSDRIKGWYKCSKKL